MFTLGVTLIGRSKLPHVRLELLQVRSELPHLGNFDRSLIQNVFKKINHHYRKGIKLNPIQDRLFRVCSRPFYSPPSLKPVTHILQWWNLAQLYLTQRRSKNYMNHVIHLLSSADISVFSPEISKLCYIKKYRHRLHFDT